MIEFPSKADLSTLIAWAIAYAVEHGRKPRLHCSFSFGRSSAFMSKMVKDHLTPYFDVVFMAANTGWEHEDSLRFGNDVDRYLGLNLVWVEAVVHPDKRKSSTHRVVTYETASRHEEPFLEVVRKYGIPNKTFGHCTRELKLNAMRSYLRSIGWDAGTYLAAVGIRRDETRRLKLTADLEGILYPLRDLWPVDKLDVLLFWEDYEYDLRISEEDGNCRGCYKKSDNKLNTVYRRTPEIFEFPIHIHREYGRVGPNRINGVLVDEPRKMYRGYRSAEDLIAFFKERDVDTSRSYDTEESGNCSESCEPYEMESPSEAV